MPNNLPQKTPPANDADEYIVVASEMVDEATEAVNDLVASLTRLREYVIQNAAMGGELELDNMPSEVGFLFKEASSIRKILGEMSHWIDTAVADDIGLVRIRW